MCGIVGGYARGEIGQMLVEGLRRLEYRGYDSAGVVIADHHGALRRARAMGKVSELATQLGQFPLAGSLGIAHTRWATHGVPSERNAHPHISRNRVAVVHNGIIENHAELRVKLTALGYIFTSETDTEVAAHWIEHRLCEAGDLLTAVRQAVQDFEGAYALGVICSDAPDRLIATRKGSPLVIGLGDGENYIASDSTALLKVTQRFVYLEEGDFVELKQSGVRIFDECGNEAARPVRLSSLSFAQAEKGAYDHYMLKEIHEQPRAVADTLEGRIVRGRVLVNSFGPMAAQIFARVRQVQIVACGTSYHAGMVARYWFEDILGLPSQVEIASEFRYRNPVLQEHTLMVLVSQSGETADTLAALRNARSRHPGLMSLAVCNVPESSLVRESDLVLMTNAGPEVGVASTKAFSTQLAALGLLLVAMGKVLGRLSDGQEARIVEGLEKIPGRLADALRHDAPIRALARRLVSRQHALFLGRGTMYPIALEGALKLKEISYIHAEAYPAGELKHGPLALIDADMPVIAVAPCNDLLKKLKSNLEEVSARGAELFLFTDEFSEIVPGERIHVLPVTANVGRISAPVIFNVPLQLLAYHVAVLRGSDVDQPRNLAKSVTVE
uniref:Glutamine--fructose-6-phosphate aminotransferase [isomerizing] n=1 Tax=Candidatus Nitrotoga fabula TaxID=2182327 RepID=A0A2X0QYN0_9PROT|nr:L-glutamine:D-fructose-6-phosphate aminotransferase [Candidatus Nitrotoga fabula]